jgi:hypothetical protein
VGRGYLRCRFAAIVDPGPDGAPRGCRYGAVTLKGWRGRLYFVPVRLLHDAVTRSMMAAAVRRLGA